MGLERDVLRAELARARAGLDNLEGEYAALADPESVALDDEHDSEGSTVGFERARVAGLIARSRGQVADLDDATGRADAGAYGYCSSCGSEIGTERLACRRRVYALAAPAEAFYPTFDGLSATGVSPSAHGRPRQRWVEPAAVVSHLRTSGGSSSVASGTGSARNFPPFGDRRVLQLRPLRDDGRRWTTQWSRSGARGPGREQHADRSVSRPVRVSACNASEPAAMVCASAASNGSDHGPVLIGCVSRTSRHASIPWAAVRRR